MIVLCWLEDISATGDIISVWIIIITGVSLIVANLESNIAGDAILRGHDLEEGASCVLSEIFKSVHGWW